MPGPTAESWFRKFVRRFPDLADPAYLDELRRRSAAWLESVWDLPRLRHRFPWLESYHDRVRGEARELEEIHSHYTSSVSTWGMAVSLELAVFLLTFCRRVGPRTILDLGSGFSSFVFRLHAAQAGTPRVRVESVDHDAAWLKKTSAFLEGQHLDPAGLITWEECKREKGRSFDLILFDMGMAEMRPQWLDDVLALVSRSGHLILDDMHNEVYRRRVKNRLGELGFGHLSLRPMTLDRIGRYSILAFRKREATGR